MIRLMKRTLFLNQYIHSTNKAWAPLNQHQKKTPSGQHTLGPMDGS